MSDLQLKTIIERILRLHQEEDELKADRREVYAEAKANGYDKTALGAAVSIIRKREKDAAGFEERNAIVDLYLSAFDGSSHVRAYAHTREAEPDASPDLSPAVQNEGAAGESPEQEAPERADGGAVAVHSAQGAAFVTQPGAGEGGLGAVPGERNPAPAADVRQAAKPKPAPIDLTIPAFLDRRAQPRPGA
jgi:uncharacterized protein (UPF0335 family)